MSRVIVKNLPTDCTEDALKNLVSRVGTVTDISLKYAKNGAFRKFAFVGFLQEAEATNAVKLLDKSFLHSSRLSVQVASALGDKEKPRAWSKYAKDSSRNVAAQKAKDEAEEKIESGKEKPPRVNEELKRVEEDPAFAEFLKIHDAKVNRGATWGNDVDGSLPGKKDKKGIDGKGSRKEAVEDETSEEKLLKKKKKKKKKTEDTDTVEQTELKDVNSHASPSSASSDLDYLKSKKTTSDVFSDSEDVEDDEDEDGEVESDDKNSEKKQGEVVDDNDAKMDEGYVEEGEGEEEECEDGDQREKKSNDSAERFMIKMRGLPFKAKEKEIRQFFHPVKVTEVKFARWKKKSLGIAHAFFPSKADASTAMKRNKDLLGGRYIELFFQHRKPTSAPADDVDCERDPAPWELKAAALQTDGDDALIETGRIFVRNLSYLCKTEDLEALFFPFGPVVETHLSLDPNTKRPKGFAFVTYMMPEHAVTAFNALDGTIFQGRMLHLLPARAKKEVEEGDDVSFKKKKEAELKKKSVQAHTWNSLFLGANAVADVVADKYNTTKSAVLDAGGRGSLAVRMALGETQIVNETREFLINNGVCLDAFEKKSEVDKSGSSQRTSEGKPLKTQRSAVCLLAKNLPAGTTASEIGELFSPFGTLARLVLPPSGITAIVEFQEAIEAKTAFRRLAYSKFKHLPLYLEWAPVGVFKPDAPKGVASAPQPKQRGENSREPGTSESEEVDADQAELNATLYAKNLNFATEDASLKMFFASYGPVVGAVIARHKDAKSGEVLSRGYGFVQFLRAKDAQAALKGLQNVQLEGHNLELKLSNRNGVASGAKSVAALGEKQSCITEVPSSKILVRNIPFEAKQKEIEELFKGFGELKSVRLPKKAVGKGKHRGFAFVEFLSKENAKKAFDTFKHSTHLLGRRLVLEWAAEEEDVEAVRKRTADKFGDGREEDESVKRMKKATVDADQFLKGKGDDL